MILPLEQQVSNLDLSKRLKELGVRQESYFVHVKSIHGRVYVRSEEMDFGNEDVLCSAFTVAELGEMLPAEELDRINKDKDRWLIIGIEGIDYTTTEADARAKMLIYLIENKLMEVPHA